MSSTSMSTTVAAHHSSVTLGTAMRTGGIAAAIAVAANVVISVLARGPLGAGDDFVPLSAGPIILWTVIGALVGALGWRLIVNRSARSRALLTWLVPTVLVLSLVPDIGLLITDSTPGQSTTGVIALMILHVVTAAILVSVYRRVMPVAPAGGARG